jgi:8-oxo-dGTP pyrophosphatase MutT (NUDIX family)
MNTHLTQAILAHLRAHVAFDAVEEKHRLDTISFIEHHSTNWWQRNTIDGHVTAAAWVLNAERTHALLLHHAKLNRWLQPGGHLDDTDESPAHGALREAIEESGIATLSLVDTALFDVDVHPIPERKIERGNETEHLHYDVRFLIMAKETNVVISDESLGAQWMSLSEIVASHLDESITRLAKKSFLLDNHA